MSQNRRSIPSKDQLKLFPSNPNEHCSPRPEQKEDAPQEPCFNHSSGKIVSMSASGRSAIYEKILERTMR